MKSYTYSEARQNFAAILEQAYRDGAVRIQRRDGQSFVLTPEPRTVSPLDIPGIQLDRPVTRDTILEALAESRRRYDTGDA
ncbi:type II toxin-antitoxin system Phd/YefM family antitoxin [Candidatus Viridilinea mediisalina]|uniref:Antitoxin n=1 Tax=Candidatus Viridilinea mediisalina TaxID=2024553 RepID=A0A2A6RKH3_9CHLR|nr:type II toxin-antitoxin system Phd/YefM family antitoxin [Candidatus Viridilinea mediisalina]PDW03386.1 prevent-host-death protein [Candidatus Viridilinea mediisalina]